MNDGVVKKDTKTGEITQVYDNLSFGEAFAKVTELRAKKDKSDRSHVVL